MALYVQKFGGVAVGSSERIKEVAERVIAGRKAGHDIVVVVSAMEGETDRLIKLAAQFDVAPNPREYAVLVSTGEQVTMSLLCMALMAQGQPACSYTGAQIGLRTSDSYQKARILEVETNSIHKELKQGKVVVVAGFQGINDKGEVTTLGRGGSDATAVALAAALQADECQFFKDVAGIYTADPKIVKQARLLSHISFQEMLNLATMGAKVLQDQAVMFADENQVSLRVLSCFADCQGTLINNNITANNQGRVSGITYRRQQAKLTMSAVPKTIDFEKQFILPLQKQDVMLDMLIQDNMTTDASDYSFIVNRDEYSDVVSFINTNNQNNPKLSINSDEAVAKVSVVGGSIDRSPTIKEEFSNVLVKEGICIKLLKQSSNKISAIIAEDRMEIGLQALHQAFGLHKNV